MTNTISIYSEAGGFDSRLFFPILLGRTPSGVGLSDAGTSGDSSGTLTFSWNDNIYNIEFKGKYLQFGSGGDYNGYITSATVTEYINGRPVTLGTMMIFPDADNSFGAIPVKSGAWMTPDNLLIQAATLGGSQFNLLGGAGNDKLYGSRFGDYFNGEGGKDTLTGYAGKDEFLFDAIGKANADHITDFTHKQDKILIDVSDDPTLFGDISEDSKFKKIFHDITNSAEDKDDRILYNSKTGILSFDHDGKGGDRAVVFAHLDNHAKIDFHDFLIF